MTTVIRVLDEEIQLDCAPGEQRRIEDLATALETRLSAFTGDPDGKRRLVLTALALLDETQAAGAALARARGEIERLTDMVVEAKLEAAEADLSERGRVSALRPIQGVA
ncbi:MAG: cell division protein ZapA [Hyphomonadaceae bacterium]